MATKPLHAPEALVERSECEERATPGMTGAAQVTHATSFAWAVELTARARARVGAGLPALDLPELALPERTRAPAPAPVASAGVGHDRALLDGVSPERPLEVVPTIITNVAERITGSRDDWVGTATAQLALAGHQLVQAGLRNAAAGRGVVAASSSLLGTVLPLGAIGLGAVQVAAGWNELASHDAGPLSLLGSRTARTGLLQMVSGALLLVPGVGSAVAGAATRVLAAANELDAFSALDAPLGHPAS